MPLQKRRRHYFAAFSAAHIQFNDAAAAVVAFAYFSLGHRRYADAQQFLCFGHTHAANILPMPDYMQYAI